MNLRMRLRRRPSEESAEIADIDARYSVWSSPVTALRDALGRDPQHVVDTRTAWTAWLRQHGLDTAWLPRLSIDDRSVGTLVVVEDAYEFRVPRPVVYSAGNHDVDGPLTIPCAGARYWTTRDAALVGGWDVVTTPAGACWPALESRVESLLVSNALDSRLLGWTRSLMILRDDAGASWRRLLPRFFGRGQPMLDRAISLLGEHSFQYGHWLIDYVPRALAATRLPTSIPVLMDADVAPNSLWWLRKVLPDRQLILVERGQTVDVHEVFVPLQRTFCPTGWVDDMEMTPDVWSSDPQAVAQIQALVTADVAASARTRRLWFGRREGRHRPLSDEQKLFERMECHGFEMVYPEDLSMSQLQRLLVETRDIIAPLGSQLRNVLAAPPGLRILVLLGDATASVRGGDVSFAQASGHEVALIGGTQIGPEGKNDYERGQRAYTVSPELLDVAYRNFFSLGTNLES